MSNLLKKGSTITKSERVIDYNEKIKELKYLLATIKNYLSEKTNYDNEIRQLSFDTTVTSTKKNQPKEKNLINNKA